MRISDWSSDVCTSDLRRHEARRMTETTERLPEALPRIICRLDDIPDLEGKGFELAGPKGPIDMRSEEHTSELQSLTRISYAVFCLKQKNNTHKQRQYT